MQLEPCTCNAFGGAPHFHTELGIETAESYLSRVDVGTLVQRRVAQILDDRKKAEIAAKQEADRKEREAETEKQNEKAIEFAHHVEELAQEQVAELDKKSETPVVVEHEAQRVVAEIDNAAKDSQAAEKELQNISEVKNESA